MSTPSPDREPMPAPGDPVLPADRHILLREHLMREIDSSSSTPAAARRRPVRRFALTTVAAASAAALVTVLSVNGGQAGGHPVAAPRPASSAANDSAAPSGPTDSHTQAVQLLDQVATVASTQDLPTVRDDQYVYTDVIRSVYKDQNGPRWAKPHREQWWDSVDGHHAGEVLAFGERRVYQPHLLPGTPSTAPVGDFHQPTYTFLSTLPTDPKALLALIDAQPRGQMSRDEAEMSTLTFLLFESVPPPKLAAALYRAAAMIPGITVEPGHLDPTSGRHVIGLSFRAADDGVRTSWLFDSSSKTFVGYEMVQGPSAHPVKEQGFVFEYLAVLHRGIVDRLGQQP